MPPGLAIADLLEYTDWQRLTWREWLNEHPHALAATCGGRFEAVGDVVRHIFAAEKRYVDHLSGRPLTNPSGISSSDVDALFAFGRQSRAELRAFLETYPVGRWDEQQEMPFLNGSVLVASPRKIIVHVLMHEIRHWAQAATLCRLNELGLEPQDFIFSPVLGGELRRATGQS